MATGNFDNVIITGIVDTTQLVVKGSGSPNPAQTTPLQDWQNSAGTTLASVDKDGKISVAGFTMATGAADGYVLQSNYCGVGTWVPANGMVGSSSALCNGRLTLTSGMAVTTGDVTAAQYIYFTPYKGNRVTLYNGTWWSEYALTEVSVAVPASPNPPTAPNTNTAHDVFLYDDAPNGLKLNIEAWTLPDNGSVTSISSTAPVTVTVPASPAHTLVTDQLVTIANNTVAANNGTWRVGTTTATTFQLKTLAGADLTAPGTVGTGGTWQRADQNTSRATALVLQNGVWVKSGGTDNWKYRYLGTIRTTGVSGQCEDSIANRFVWNNYNRMLRKLKAIDTTNTWTYGTAAWRAARNDLANRVSLIVGINEDLVRADVLVHTYVSTGIAGGVGIGINSLTNNADLFSDVSTSVANEGQSHANYHSYLNVGYNFIQWLEYSRASTTTFWGDGGTASIQSGMLAEVLA